MKKMPHLCLVPYDQDLVVYVGVSKVSTRALVSIGYGAYLIDERWREIDDYNY